MHRKCIYGPDQQLDIASFPHHLNFQYCLALFASLVASNAYRCIRATITRYLISLTLEPD